MKIISILEGIHSVEQKNGKFILKDHTGSVTLVQDNGLNILIDVGGRGTIETVKSNLLNLGLSLCDIDYVLLTHLHLDHSYNISYFSDSKVIAWSHFWNFKETVRLDVDGFFVTPNIWCVKTPGHAEEHISIFIKNGSENWVVSGDAVSPKFVESGEISMFTYDSDLYMESANKIMDFADYIIPGHGPTIILSEFKK